MPISYSTLFGRLGKAIKWMNAFVSYQGTQIQGAAPNGVIYDVNGQYTSRLDLVPTLDSTGLGWSGTMGGWVAYLKGIADATLGDLQATLDAPSSSPNVILPLLYTQMVADSQTINQNTGISATVTAGSGNHGTGLLLASVKNVLGGNDERILNEVVTFRCATDQWAGTASAGSETFSITGYPKLSSPNIYGTLGNGNGPNISVGYSKNLLTNGNMESWTTTANVPDGWTLDAGTAGTNSFQDGTAAEVHTGSNALKLAGDGTTATITLHQNINTLVKSSNIYCASVWLRKSGTVSAGSTFKVQVTGTGFGPYTLFSADPSTLTTSYANFFVFFDTSSSYSSDIKLQITWTAANTAGASAVILVDDVLLVQPTMYGNVAYVLTRGSTDFATGDTFSVTTANGNGGVFQTAFARWWNFQLPSSGSPTILDSLAV